MDKSLKIKIKGSLSNSISNQFFFYIFELKISAKNVIFRGPLSKSNYFKLNQLKFFRLDPWLPGSSKVKFVPNICIRNLKSTDTGDLTLTYAKKIAIEWFSAGATRRLSIRSSIRLSACTSFPLFLSFMHIDSLNFKYKPRTLCLPVERMLFWISVA
jgi:hypothetical protein